MTSASESEDLFAHANRNDMEKNQPLAARMRPRTLDEFVGQDHILAPGRLLRRAIEADQLSSLIFYGPPGTGKTTLASVIAHTTQSRFRILNAVLAGVKDVRDVCDEAQRARTQYRQRTILFVDEVHRWNKAQQDALLPFVENGTIILIGATTENPYFTVNRPLVSRSRIFQLKPLSDEDLHQVARQALADADRGYGGKNVNIDPQALDHLVNVANGDARALLNALELAVETTEPEENGCTNIDMNVAEDSIQKRAVLYDREGDYHFDTISAFIKSLRGSDPDAAVYWLAKMVYAGEDPRFIFRRMLIFCGEDVGLADPHALTVVQSAADAFDRVGMPEGRYHLAMATLYLATAPKSNSTFAFFDALSAVEKEAEAEVPTHLKDDHRDSEGFGHGAGYLYPHAYRNHWVAQQYLPSFLRGRIFYQPGELGYEGEIAEQVRRRREVQLAAAMDPGTQEVPPEVLTYSPRDRDVEEWLDRTVNNVPEQWGRLRDDLFEKAQCRRHEIVLDLSGDSGVFTWEALRKAPEGGVWSLVSNTEVGEAVEGKCKDLPELRRPHIVVGSVTDFGQCLEQDGYEQMQFDLVIGRSVLTRVRERVELLSNIRSWLKAEGRLCLAEALPRHAQRLYNLIETKAFDEELRAKLCEAEERIYADTDDPMVNWDTDDLSQWFQEAGFKLPVIELMEQCSAYTVTAGMIERWFTRTSDPHRPSYADRLSERLSKDEIGRVRSVFEAQLKSQSIRWHSWYCMVYTEKES